MNLHIGIIFRDMNLNKKQKVQVYSRGLKISYRANLATAIPALPTPAPKPI